MRLQSFSSPVAALASFVLITCSLSGLACEERRVNERESETFAYCPTDPRWCAVVVDRVYETTARDDRGSTFSEFGRLEVRFRETPDSPWRIDHVIDDEAFKIHATSSRSWVADIEKFDCESHEVAIKWGDLVPSGPDSQTVIYRWSWWDVAANVETNRIGTCASPFDSLREVQRRANASSSAP